MSGSMFKCLNVAEMSVEERIRKKKIVKISLMTLYAKVHPKRREKEGLDKLENESKDFYVF